MIKRPQFRGIAEAPVVTAARGSEDDLRNPGSNPGGSVFYFFDCFPRIAFAQSTARARVPCPQMF